MQHSPLVARQDGHRAGTGAIVNGPMKKMRTVLMLAAVVALAASVLVSVCADGGSMGGRYRTCGCLGLEWELYDRTPADGPRRTLCLGLVRSRTCYRTTGGPVVECR